MIKPGPELSWINGFKTKSAKRILLHIFTPSSSVVMRTLFLQQDVIWQSTSWEMLSCGHILHQHCSTWQWTGRAALTCFLKAPGSLSCAYETVIRGCLWKSEVQAVDVVTSSQSLLLYRPRKLSGSFPAVGSESEIEQGGEGEIKKCISLRFISWFYASVVCVCVIVFFLISTDSSCTFVWLFKLLQQLVGSELTVQLFIHAALLLQVAA